MSPCQLMNWTQWFTLSYVNPAEKTARLSWLGRVKICVAIDVAYCEPKILPITILLVLWQTEAKHYLK